MNFNLLEPKHRIQPPITIEKQILKTVIKVFFKTGITDFMFLNLEKSSIH